MLFVSALSANAAVAQEADALIGRWVVNIQKSELGSGPPMQSQVRTFDHTEDGMLLVTLESVNANGNRSFFHWYTKLDDQQHPEFQRGRARTHVNTIALKRIDDHNYEIINKRIADGKTFSTGTATLSADGKTLTWRTNTLDDQGKETARQVRVYEKQ
jgi:hypothetical protein